MENINYTPKVEFCSGIREHDMDLMFIEEFSCSEAFANLFMSKIGITDFQIVKLVHSQYEEGNGIDVETQSLMVCNDNIEVDSRGESDITVIYTSHDQTKALLIEDKINATQQPNQYERYLARGRKTMNEGLYDGFEVFLVAPESYYAPEYKNKVTYEEVKAYFEKCNSSRSAYKIALISKALQKKSHSGIVIPAENVMDFYDGYVRFVHDNHPTLPLDTQAGIVRGPKSNWFQYKSCIPDVDLIHQALRKNVSIQINKLKENDDVKKVKVIEWLKANKPELFSMRKVTINVNKTSLSIKHESPLLNTGDSIYNQIDKAEESFEIIEKAIELLKELKNKGFVEFLSRIR